MNHPTKSSGLYHPWVNILRFGEILLSMDFMSPKKPKIQYDAILGMFLAHNFLKEGRYALAIFEYHDFKFLPPELPPLQSPCGLQFF